MIARDYIAHGMRARASDLITRELGPEIELEIIRKLEREVGAERFTRLDRGIVRTATDGVLSLADRPERDPARHAIRIGRLRTLERMGLAEETNPGVWRIGSDMEPTLRRMGERGDIIKTIHRDLASTGLSRAVGDQVLFDAGAASAHVIGRIVAEGFADELRDRRYVIVDGIDGRAHYVDLGVRRRSDEPFIRNTIVEVRPRAAEQREVDRTIARIAAGNSGLYSAELHREVDPRASSEYIASHVRRLEAMRHENLLERRDDGSWPVGAEHLDRAARFEAVNRSRSPARVTVLSWQSLDELPQATGATWLDRWLIARTPDVIGAVGFGSEVETALRARRQWLLDQGLAREQHGQIVYARDLLKVLERRELAQIGRRIASETGLDFREVKKGDTITGTYRRMLTLSSGRFALIERAHDFTLVSWRPVLERAKGQSVSGAVGGDGISWSVGRKRGLGR